MGKYLSIDHSTTLSALISNDCGMARLNALAVLPFLWNKNLNAILHHSIASYGLILFITIAAFIYIGLFDFAAKPAGALYFIAYLAVGIPLLFVFRKLGTGVQN